MRVDVVALGNVEGDLELRGSVGGDTHRARGGRDLNRPGRGRPGRGRGRGRGGWRLDALRVAVTSDVNLLVKGSRFMRMERVVEALDSTKAMGGGA